MRRNRRQLLKAGLAASAWPAVACVLSSVGAAGGSHVTCEFAQGKLAKWELVRPPVAPEAPPALEP